MNKCISTFNLFITLGGHCTYFRRIDHNFLGYFFDAKGDVVTDIKIHNELIGLPLSALKTIPVRVGVAGGENKAEAIAAAMKGGYINALVTDQDTAAAILRS